MKKIKLSGKKILCSVLALTILGGTLPNEIFYGLGELFSPLFANAADEEVTIHKDVPECEFIDELYDGSGAISPLPKTAEYKDGCSAPKNISLTDFQEKFGKGAEFDIVGAKTYTQTDGYKIMLCNAEELYLYSRITNERDDTSESECKFYLSANIILGNNIEYTEMSEKGKYFLPIGGDKKSFTGTFDGQGFEIRDIYFDKSYSYVTVGFFGVIGKGAEVKNFGIYHPTIYTVIPASYTAVIASRNNGTITDVYAIANEYKHETSVNLVTSANANCATGLVAQNNENGIIKNSYFAGMLNASEPHSQHPVCAENDGTITNCYYDKDIFKYGTSGTQIDNPDDENMKPLSNIELKKVEISENGMQNTNFKVHHVNTISDTDENSINWGYPRLYGFTGTGTEDDPYIISTPADLIYFPCSYEYQYNVNKNSSYLYFALEKCIDMNEVAPNAYKPKVNVSFETNDKTAVIKTYKISESVFRNVFLGTAHDDEKCTLKHISQGQDSEGKDLQECHMIYNLTIDTPATFTSGKNMNYYTAFIAYANGDKNKYKNPKIKNVQFVGGEISSGSTDCMPTENNAGLYNVKTATVVARTASGASNAAGIDMDNVHSSAAVKLGTGQQYSTMIGGLTAWGVLHFISNCTNSGDVIGGYIDAPENSGIVAENFKIGGLFGAAGATNNTQWGWATVIENVANYGNVYGVVIVDDKDSEKILTGGSVYVAGVSTENIATLISKTIENPNTDSLINFDDTNRSQKIANFGMIFDGPVELDENSAPVFDENGKPKALQLDDNKKILGNSSPVYITDIYGIGSDRVCNAYNGGNIYSIMIEKCRVAGIGNMSLAASGTNYYNCMNYNAGDIYMYVGALGASGVSNNYAYKCYNSGNIFVCGGEIVSNSNTGTVGGYGVFSGVARYLAYGCYNAGDVYIAPTARKVYKGTSTSNIVVVVSGISGIYSGNLTQNGKTVKNINAGNITVDLDKNKFNPVLYTNDTNNNSYYPLFFMEGTGLGSGNENYGKISFIPNSDDTSKMIKLRVTGCGGTSANYTSRTCDDCINYADISVDVPNGIYNISITGVNRSRKGVNDSYTVSNNINFGNITFSGITQGDAIINTVWGSENGGNVSDCINLGNVTVKEGSYIGGVLRINNYYISSINKDWTCKMNSVMNGWYDGCTVPSSLDTKENKEIFNSLDKTKRYGVVKVSGYAKNAYITTAYISNSSYAEVENIVNNGEFEITNANYESNLYLYGISNGKVSNSKNYASVNVNNVLLRGSACIAGAAGGKSNINYADITVKNCVTQAVNNANQVLFVSGISHNNGGSCLENRGNLTVDNLYTAVYNGITYYSPKKYNISGRYDASVYVSGICNTSALVSVSDSINFGDISVNNAMNSYIGGINGSNVDKAVSASQCVNYGDIELKNSGGESLIGGIFPKFGTAENCANFGNIYVENPTSYRINTDPRVYIGGINGYSKYEVSCCANYGNITYVNTNGLNSQKEAGNTNSLYSLYIGGTLGYTKGKASYIMNYGDIKVSGEQNMTTFIGGIIGAAESQSYNMINYGDITFSKEENISSYYVGGILGRANNNTNLKYGINYGSINKTDDIETKTYIGSLLGGTGNNKFSMDRFVDLSNIDDGSEPHPLMGMAYNTNCCNTSSDANYTMHEDAIAKTQNSCGECFGTVKKVTLDKDDETGLYSANFVFRSKLMHELSEYTTNQSNGLMYQDIKYLSPYLRSYMKERFGDDICGAYVMVNGSRSPDKFFPDGLSSEYVFGNKTEYKFEFGCTDNIENSSLINQEFPNDIYSDYANENYGSLRTIKSDLEYYAQQVIPSSMAELYGFGLRTKYAYGNTDTSDYQYFDEYKCYIETNPAVMSDNSVSDTLLYTDINVYVAIDDIDSSKVRKPKLDENGNFVYDDDNNMVYEDIDTNNNIYFNAVIDLASYYSSIKFYTGDITDTTERGNEALYNHYTDPYPDDFWLTPDNLSEQLADTTQWSKSYLTSGYIGELRINNSWEIAVPFNDINTDTKNMYTKVLGVMTAEDGVHQNIIVVHVIIDLYKPYAELDSVELNTPSNGKVTSTVDNNGMTAEGNKDSLTDKITDDEGNEVPKQDVYYYYMSDNITPDGSNIQKYQTNSGDVVFTVTTHNMSTEESLWAKISWQDRVPSLNGEDYNDPSILWNDEATGRNSTEFEVNPTDVVYDEQNKSIGTATFKFNNSNIPSSGSYGGIYYGGLYRVDLYYERTKNSGIKKHFATVFFWKEHSPENKNLRLGYNIDNRDETEDDTVLQYAYASDGAGNYSYASANINFRYISREENESNNNKYYSSKAYLSSNPTQNYYIDADNPIYNSLDEDEEKGYNPNLETRLESINVYVDEETGAFYPANFCIDMQIMSENAQIRHMRYQRVHYGTYGRYNTLMYDYPPVISLSSVTKNGYNIIADGDGIYKAVVDGDENQNPTFTLNWTNVSSRVNLFHSSNRPAAIKENSIYDGDGYNADKIKIYFMGGSDTDYTLLTDEEVKKCFSKITVNTNNVWTLEFCSDAPCGMYKVIPYHTYHMDFSTANSEQIKLYDYNTGEPINTDDDSNIFEWTIPYSTPFYIENVPNDESYIMEFEVNNDQSTPVILEDENNADGSEDRYAYIVEASENQEVIYNGYEDVMTGETRVDKFVISAFVGKNEQESSIRIKVPYCATLSKWTGTGTPIAADGTISDASWESVSYDESITVSEDYKQYTFDVNYNEFAADGSTYTGNSSVTYYKVTAEDGKTETVYTVNIVPGVRNKKTTLEIANSTDELNDVIKDELSEAFETSDEIYKEIMEKYGPFSATIKELKGDTVDTYQSKWFDGAEGSDTKPSVYNLKSYEYDVSIDLPAGYTYDVIILSEEKDSYQTLKNSINGFDGKRLVLSSPDSQNLNIRIILKRDVSDTVWGVQYIWNPYIANLNESNYTQIQGGGVFNNHVYSITSDG